MDKDQIMRINLQRETLLTPLQKVMGVVERKQTMPILSNVLLQIKDNKLSFTGTDTEVELIGQCSIPQEDTSAVKLTLPGRKLVDICRGLPENAAIELYQEKEKVIVRSGRSRFTLATLPADDFPSSDATVGYLAFTMAQNQLKTLLNRTYFAMAQQDVRYYLNGMLMELVPDCLRTIATDGHRLAYNAVQLATNVAEKTQIIIPRKGVLELMRLLEDNEHEVGITLSNGHIHVAGSEFTFTSKLVEGRFPDYDRVIPRGGDKTIIMDRDILKQALSRTAILCNEKYKGVRVELNPNTLTISATNPEQESAEELLQIDYDLESLDVGFNVNYVIDALNNVDSGPVKLTFSNANTGVVIEEVENQWQSIFVVMPMRL